jgi:hypothetical protein
MMFKWQVQLGEGLLSRGMQHPALGYASIQSSGSNISLSFSLPLRKGATQ